MREMLQLRAWLVESEPEVWRQFVIDPRLTLEQLHTVLQIAFNWQNEHFHQFHEQDGRRYGRPNAADEDLIDERKLHLGQVFDHDQKRILYEYDFGDSWIHAVEREKIVDGETFDYPSDTFIQGGKSVFSGKPRAAICIAGARNGPPENCGGLDGYFDILDLLENPKAPRSQEQKDLLEWLEDWEPDRFVLGEINQNLGRVRVKKTKGGYQPFIKDACRTKEASESQSSSTPTRLHGCKNIEYSISPSVEDADLNRLFAAAWPGHIERAFAPVLARSLIYVCAYESARLVGFVNVAWDGGLHAFLLDTTDSPDCQHQGVGTELVRRAAKAAAEAGVEWLHVDYEEHVDVFYRKCGFRPTKAGIMRLER